ncbi:MAG: Hint domain-containing protein, partial [Sphingomonadales bacterium]|nr:Hint domain-containing protein [Sphingomonadales bacterium]
TGAGADTIAFADLDGNDFIVDFDMTVVNGLTTDQLDVSDLHDSEGNPVNAWDVTITDDGAGNAVLSFPGGESLTLLGVSPAQVATAPQLAAMGIPCFVSGTRIATPRGPVAVERLGPGDLVNTRDGPPAPVLWAGRRSVTAAQMRADPRLCPVEFKPGALGNDAVLRLSAQHCVFVPAGATPDPGIPGSAGAAPAGALVRAGQMAAAGWGGARRMRGARGAEFHHLFLPRHALIVAEGAWVESFWPGRQALAALESPQRFALIRAFPALAGVLWGAGRPETLYAPRVRGVLPRCQVDRSACANWSRTLQQAPFSDGFTTDRKAPWKGLNKHGFAG